MYGKRLEAEADRDDVGEADVARSLFPSLFASAV
jgi:hypothetical protein